MRNLKQKILIVSVFFVVLSLTGCGIPSILYLSTSDYTFTTAENDTTKSVGISSLVISSEDEEGYLDDCNGPSVMFFYTIGDSEIESSINASGNIPQTVFATQYVNTPYGVAISKSNNEVLTFSVTEDSTTTERTLYAFSTEGETSQAFTHPHYVLYTDNAVGSLSSCSLNYDTTNRCFVLSQTGYTPNATSLYRYNGEAFKSTDYSAEDDYKYISDSSDICVFIYAAFSISKTSTSSFSNNFWSSLTYLGYVNVASST